MFLLTMLFSGVIDSVGLETLKAALMTSGNHECYKMWQEAGSVGSYVHPIKYIYVVLYTKTSSLVKLVKSL